MLLRKTKASTVEDTLIELLSQYNNPENMLLAKVDSISKLIRPLGLHRIRAQAFMSVSEGLILNHGGNVPSDYTSLVKLPHVGRYTANAVLCTAFGKRCPMVDANVVRIFCRMFDLSKPNEVHKSEKLWSVAQTLIPSDAKAFNWALIDLGALICFPKRPACSSCPLEYCCEHAKSSSLQ